MTTPRVVRGGARGVPEALDEPAGRPDDVQVNVVRLRGRVSAEAAVRALPSGDEMVQLRLVVPREEATRRRRPAADERGLRRRPGRQVDTIDVTCWSAAARAAALRLQVGDVADVHGALRRRFFRAGPSVQSRYEVEAHLVRRVARA